MRRYITICLFIVCAALQGFAEVIGRPVMQTVADEARIYKLWYDEPAQVWTEALPLGNGRLGAMVYGTPAMENIQLNEETLWAGRPNNNANPNALEYIPKVRQLVFEGKYLEAQTLATEKVMAKTNSGMPYQSFGHLRIAFPGHTRYTDYYRELSLDSARTVVCYTVDGVRYRRETITSYNPQIQISAESGTKRSIFRQKNKTKRSKKRLHTTLIKPEQKVNEDLCSGFIVS